MAAYCVGMLIGFWVAGLIPNYFVIEEGFHNWEPIWLLPVGFSVVVLLLFMALFKREQINSQ
ncbi:hypothetical protein [Algoriphagus sp. AGSA1]|uniref:hypothetical protein n=1 Tax=Algoriphagus sp. AGSA1 TaxID=2907213 RepID=UPI0034CDAE74